MTGVTLVVFTLMNFVLAMSATVFSGILDMVAVSLGVSVASAGLLSTMYSYGAAFGVPVILILFRGVQRPKLLKVMLAITVLMAVLLVLAQTFWQLLIIRLIMGISANSYAVLAISTVASLSAKERLGRSMAVLIAGNASALVIGVPLTRALSSVLSWQDIFWVLAGMMILALVYFILRLPGGERSPSVDIRSELAFFKDKRVLSVVLFSLMMFLGYGALYTYITPFLLDVFPAAESSMTFVLVLLGAACFTGNLIGGHVADRIGCARSMLLGGLIQLMAVALILLSQPVGWLVVAFALLWIMGGWFTGLQLNAGIAQATHNRSSFMISVNNSAVQLGSAVGSSLGAVVISLSGIRGIVFITLSACLIIVAMQWVTLKKKVWQDSDDVETRDAEENAGSSALS